MSATSDAAERHTSPFRLDLDQQRKRAKELLRAARAGQPAAIVRFGRNTPATLPPPAGLRLAGAQHVVARELGVASWPKLVAHIAAMTANRVRIDAGGAAPDGALPTLHLRCGEDIAASLRAAGFTGDFLDYSDPFCQGPVVAAPDWQERRAAFLDEAYGAGTGRSLAETRAKLAQAEAALAAAAASHRRVVLWFEHDSYDQLILARCLARFAGARPPRLELVSPGHFPGAMRFIGLGQLPPEALRLLWSTRREVSGAMLAAGDAAWDALRASDPSALGRIARDGTPALPQLGGALRRHAQELPWTDDGLALSERLLLELVAEAPRRIGEAYGRLMLEREPLPWQTDLMIRATVERLRRGSAPLFTGHFTGADRDWPSEVLTITPLGRQVLAGEVDWLTLDPPPRWVGGVMIAHARTWRWNEALGRPQPG